GGHREFCGVDCFLGQACPEGYRCDGVVILTEQICGANADCRCDRASIRFATATCTVSVTCDPRMPDGRPDPNTDYCFIKGEPECNGGTTTGTATCIVHRGLNVGACECRTNDDCPSGGTCVDGLCCMGGVPHPTRNCQAGEADVSGFCSCETD